MANPLATTARLVRTNGVAGLRESLARLRHSSDDTHGDPVLDADWDVLVVLGGCRGDTFREVVRDGDYPFEVGTRRRSPASAGDEWVETVFSDDAAVDSLAYVTASPHSATVDTDRFGHARELWRDSWTTSDGVSPEIVTDHAITTWRAGETDRLVVQYLQPRVPALDDAPANVDTFDEQESEVWNDLRQETRSLAAVRREYKESLATVLDSVSSLLDNLDAEDVVITADHGVSFGDDGIYGHPRGIDTPSLRTVPWVTTSGTDTESRVPDITVETSDSDAETDDVIQDRLEHLGYS